MTETWKLTERGKVFLDGVSAKNTIRASLEEYSPNDEREVDEIIAAYEAFIIQEYARRPRARK